MAPVRARFVVFADDEQGTYKMDLLFLSDNFAHLEVLIVQIFLLALAVAVLAKQLVRELRSLRRTRRDSPRAGNRCPLSDCPLRQESICGRRFPARGKKFDRHE